MLLPDPEIPTSATVAPSSRTRSIPSKTLGRSGSYRNVTPSKRTTPRTGAGKRLGSVGDSMATGWSKISKIRCAAPAASWRFAQNPARDVIAAEIVTA